MCWLMCVSWTSRDWYTTEPDPMEAIRAVFPSVFPDESALWAYLDATAGGLIAVAARALGGGEALAERAGRALGLANWFQALPALEAAGVGSPEAAPRAAASTSR